MPVERRPGILPVEHKVINPEVDGWWIEEREGLFVAADKDEFIVIHGSDRAKSKVLTLPPPPPSGPVGWTIVQLDGEEVFKAPASVPPEEVTNWNYWPLDESGNVVHELITDPDGVKEGDLLFATDRCVGRVFRCGDGLGVGDPERMVGFLRFPSNDYRKCWVISGWANVASLRRLKLER